MKQLAIFSCFLFSAFHLFSQDISGDWNGALKIKTLQIRLIFHIKNDNGTWTATMDSPDQNGFGIPVDKIRFEGNELSIEMARLGLNYLGKVNEDYTQVTGKLTQMGQSFPMNLQRETIKRKIAIRPQEPALPYRYYVDEVTYDNKVAGIQLSGTLTLPDEKGVYPTVILISGSGPQNRDSEMLGHKPFLVIADYLTRQGIGVLRFDDRGVKHSTGKHHLATSADFATDVQAGIDYLKTRKEVNSQQIGLIGHSEGGMIAPMVAAQSEDVAFMLLLAAPGLPISELMLQQVEILGRANGGDEKTLQKNINLSKEAYQWVQTERDTTVLKEKLTALFSKFYKKSTKTEQEQMGKREDFVKQQVKALVSPWYRYFLNYNPTTNLEKTTCPVLALNGKKDVQVAPTENLAAIENALKKGGNKQVMVQELEDLNHLFQHAEMGMPSEYEQIDETFAPKVLKLMGKWILRQVN